MGINITPVNHPKVHNNTRFHQAMRVDDPRSIVMTSGQVSIDENGNSIYVGNFTMQAETVLRSIIHLAEASGSSVDRIIKMNVYVTDIQCRSEFVRIREEIFGIKLPPMTMVEVSSLVSPDWLVEIDAIAVC